MRRKKYPIHPDFKRWRHMNPPLNRVALPVMQASLGALFGMQRSSDHITVDRLTIPARQGATIGALLLSPKGLRGDAPCLLYLHGGGFVLPAAPYHYKLAREYAARAECRVMFANYRLAPKYPFPTAPEDCCAAYEWLLSHAAECHIDPARIAVAGDSAGGELATVVCLMARDRGDRLPRAQMLLYPVTGRGIDTPSMREYVDTPMCNSRDIEQYDKLYAQDPSAGKAEYLSPIHAPSLVGLPDAYIETAQFDCLRDGGILYADRLREAGVTVEINNTEGTIHGFDIVLNSPIVRACVDRRIAFLRRAFYHT